MNDLKEGDILYSASLFNNRISVGKHVFVEYVGNRILIETHGFACAYRKTDLFRTPIEAFEFALKKYADMW